MWVSGRRMWLTADRSYAWVVILAFFWLFTAFGKQLRSPSTTVALLSHTQRHDGKYSVTIINWKEWGKSPSWCRVRSPTTLLCLLFLISRFVGMHRHHSQPLSVIWRLDSFCAHIKRHYMLSKGAPPAPKYHLLSVSQFEIWRCVFDGLLILCCQR